MEPVHETKANPCTKCGHVIEYVADLGNRVERAPRPGSFAMCLECGWTMIYDEDMRLRDMTPRETNDIIGDPRFIRTQMMRPILKRRLEKWRQQNERRTDQA